MFDISSIFSGITSSMGSFISEYSMTGIGILVAGIIFFVLFIRKIITLAIFLGITALILKFLGVI